MHVKKYITVYLLLLLTANVILLSFDTPIAYLGLPAQKRLFLSCAMVAMLAGILYCLRGLYVNTGLGQWDSNWVCWYFLRPVTSGISGFASCIFLKAGLLTLGASAPAESVSFGYLAFAFIAGYNVDCFMKKIEAIAEELWGIDKTRNAKSTGSQNRSDEVEQKGAGLPPES